MSFKSLLTKSISVLLVSTSLCLPAFGQTTTENASKQTSEKSSEKRVLTIAEATKSAINCSANLKLLEKSSKTNQYIIEQSDAINYSEMDLAYDLQKNNQNMAFYKDKLGYLTESTYNKIIVTNLNLELLDKQIASMENDVKVLELQLSHGYTDELSVKSKQSELEQLKSNKITAEANLVKLKKDFQIITNLDPDKYTLENKIEYEPFRAKDSIKAYIGSRIDEMQKFSKEYAKYFDDSLSARIVTNPTNGGIDEANYAQTILKKNQLYDNIGIEYDNYMQSLMGQYTQIIDKEKTIDNTKEKIAMLDKNIAATKLKLDKGLVTAIEYDKMLLQKEELENSLINAVYEHKDLKNSLDKPWVSSL